MPPGTPRTPRERYWCDGEQRPTYRGIQGKWMNRGAWHILLAAHAMTVLAYNEQSWFVHKQHEGPAASIAMTAANTNVRSAGDLTINRKLVRQMISRLVLTCSMACSVVLTDWFHNLDIKFGGRFNTAQNEISLLGWDMFMISCVMTGQSSTWVSNYYRGQDLQWWGSVYVFVSCAFTCATGLTLAQMRVARTLSDDEWAKVGAVRRRTNRGQCILVHNHAMYRWGKHWLSIHFLMLGVVAWNTGSWPAFGVWLMHGVGFGTCLFHQRFIMPHVVPGSLLGHFGGHEILHVFGFGAHATTLLLDMHTVVVSCNHL